MSPEARPRRTLTACRPCPWTSGLQSHEEMNFDEKINALKPPPAHHPPCCPLSSLTTEGGSGRDRNSEASGSSLVTFLTGGWDPSDQRKPAGPSGMQGGKWESGPAVDLVPGRHGASKEGGGSCAGGVAGRTWAAGVPGGLTAFIMETGLS